VYRADGVDGSWLLVAGNIRGGRFMENVPMAVSEVFYQLRRVMPDGSESNPSAALGIRVENLPPLANSHFPKPSSRKVHFYHKDHLGTPRLVTDEDGNAVSRHDYEPFGVEFPGAHNPNTRRFTGHERDFETGLDYMGARYFASFDARFLSVDPSPGNLENPQSQNRYNYTLNNPLKFVDPSGKMEASTRSAFLAHTGFSAPDERNAHLAGLRGGVLHEQRAITTAPPMTYRVYVSASAPVSQAPPPASQEQTQRQEETPPSPPAGEANAQGNPNVDVPEGWRDFKTVAAEQKKDANNRKLELGGVIVRFKGKLYVADPQIGQRAEIQIKVSTDLQKLVKEMGAEIIGVYHIHWKRGAPDSSWFGKSYDYQNARDFTEATRTKPGGPWKYFVFTDRDRYTWDPDLDDFK
jgi:RHS repeat-associated protein